MKCSICGIQIDLVEDAIEQGWISSFYYELDTEHQPASENCAEVFLHSGPDGEWEVKPEYRGKLTYTDEEPQGTGSWGLAYPRCRARYTEQPYNLTHPIFRQVEI